MLTRPYHWSVLSLCLLLSANCGGAAEDRAWEQAQSRGVLRVGMDAAYPPFEDVDAENQIIGFDVDLAREIGARLGLEVEFANISYDGLFDALNSGDVDLLVSALVAAPEFEGKADFSIPYFNIGEYLVVREGSPVARMEDLHGLKLAVEFGSGGDVEARDWERRLADLDVLRYDSPGAALLAVVNGEADAALVDGITARLGVGEHPDLHIAQNVNDVLLAAAVAENSPVLRGLVDQAMRDMLADGTVQALIDHWFGVDG